MQALLSEHWHVLRFLRPRLRDGVQPLHRLLRGRPWVLLSDPATQRFHRMTPQVWQVLQLFDGRRTLDDIWTAASAIPAQAAAQPGHLAVSQHELVTLVGTLHANNLLHTQVAPDAGEMFERFERQQRQRFKQGWLNPMSIRVPLLHPDAWFDRHAGLARAVCSLPVLLLWLTLVLPALFLAWQHWAALTDNLSDRVLSASNVALIWLVYPLVKAVHEVAHGLACKAFGGSVREMGLMFLIFTPVPYVDASASYRFPSKWRRALVAAAGIMAELLLGALALYVWLGAESGLVSALAFNVVLIAGVSTLLVNGNPLMRYDGYFILCDLLEAPNLGQRATQYWVYLLDRYAFGARDAQPPLQVQGERLWLLLYGAVSPVYRLFITFGLIAFVASEYLFIGAVMAVLAAWGAIVMPLWKGWKHLSEGGSLARRRDTARRRTLLALGTAAAFIGLVPLPFLSVHQAVVWVPDEAIVRATWSGHIGGEPRPAGSTVAAGDTLLLLDSPTLTADLGVAAAAVARAQAQLRQAEVSTPAQAAPLRDELAMRQSKLDDLQARVSALQVRPTVAGRWVPKAPTELAGRHARRGDVLGYVVGGPSAIVRTAVPQEDMELIRSRLQSVQVRLAHPLGAPIAADLQRQVPGGEFELVSAALGTTGGGDIAVDPSQPGGTRALKRVFDLELRLAQPSDAAVFGDHAFVRFDLGYAPLGWQWFLRLRQLFLARFNV